MSTKSRQNSNIPNRLSVADRAVLRTKSGTRIGELAEQADIGLMYVWSEEALVHNGGTIVADNNVKGFWVAQYSGPVNVKWFGDTTLEQTFKDASDVKQSVEVDIGTYTLDADTIDFSGIKFHSLGVVTINTNTTLTVTNLNP